MSLTSVTMETLRSSDNNLRKRKKPKRQTSLENINAFPRILHVILLSGNHLKQLKNVKKLINKIIILRKLKSFVSLARFNLSMVEHKYHTNLKENLNSNAIYLILNLP